MDGNSRKLCPWSCLCDVGVALLIRMSSPQQLLQLMQSWKAALWILLEELPKIYNFHLLLEC